MFYLVLSIFIGNAMTFVYKLASVKKVDSDHLTFVNYFVAIVVNLYWVISRQQYQALNKLKNVDIAILFKEKTIGNTMFLTLTMGVIVGCIFLANLFNMKASIAANGAGITTLFGRSAFLGGIVAGIFIWNDVPSTTKFIGILLLVAALFLATDRESRKVISKPILLGLSLLIGSFAEICSKTYSTYAILEYKQLYMLVIFSVAFTICAIYVVNKDKKAGKRFTLKKDEIVYGLALGIANSFSSVLQLKLLALFSMSVVFPTLAAGGLMTMVLISKFFFKEKFTKSQYVAVAIATASLVLINL